MYFGGLRMFSLWLHHRAGSVGQSVLKPVFHPERRRPVIDGAQDREENQGPEWNLNFCPENLGDTVWRLIGADEDISWDAWQTMTWGSLGLEQWSSAGRSLDHRRPADLTQTAHNECSGEWFAGRAKLPATDWCDQIAWVAAMPPTTGGQLGCTTALPPLGQVSGPPPSPHSVFHWSMGLKDLLLAANQHQRHQEALKLHLDGNLVRWQVLPSPVVQIEKELRLATALWPSLSLGNPASSTFEQSASCILVVSV